MLAAIRSRLGGQSGVTTPNVKVRRKVVRFSQLPHIRRRKVS